MSLVNDAGLLKKHQTARQFVLEGIRDAMLSGQLVAGQELDDHALAERFGVSRTPVREALKVLEVQGFVTHRAFSRPIVAAVSPQQIEEVFLMRIALEGTAVERASMTIDETELAYLEQCAESGRRALLERDAVEWRRYNREFHTRLSAASRMPLLSREIDSLIALSSFFSTMFWGDIPHSFAEAQEAHLQLVQLCRERKPAQARKMIEEHLAASLNVQVKLAREREKELSDAAGTKAPSVSETGGNGRRRRSRSAGSARKS